MKTASLFMTPSPNVSQPADFPTVGRKIRFAASRMRQDVDTTASTRPDSPANPAPGREQDLHHSPSDPRSAINTRSRRSVGDHRTTTSARSGPVASCQYTSVGSSGSTTVRRCGSPDRTALPCDRRGFAAAIDHYRGTVIGVGWRARRDWRRVSGRWGHDVGVLPCAVQRDCTYESHAPETARHSGKRQREGRRLDPDRGSIGAETTMTLDEAATAVQQMHDAAKKVNSDIVVLCHGGPIAELADLG
jgi:hypothetical protein